MSRLRLGIVGAALVAQLVGGVFGFGLVPGAVFSGIDDNALASLTLRLAVYSNLSFLLFAAGALATRPDDRMLRCVAGAAGAYHALAGGEGFYAATQTQLLAPPAFGPGVFHTVMAAALLVAVLRPLNEDA